MKINYINRKAVLIAAFLLYEAFVILYSSLKYASYSYRDVDLAVVSQSVYDTSKGVFFPKDIFYGRGGFFVGGGHITFLPLFLSVVYAVFPNPCALLILQALFLGAGAFAVYLIARSILDSDFALYFSLAYLIYPALNYTNIYELHYIAFVIPLLLFMLYFYMKNRFRLFALFMFLSLFCQEDVSLAIIGFTLYVFVDALIGRKKIGWRWIILPFLSAFLWLWFFTITNGRVVILNNNNNIEIVDRFGNSFYSWLGHNPLEMALSIFTKPLYILKKVITAQKLKYVFELSCPLAFMPFLGGPLLISVFLGMSETLLSSWPFHNNIHFHHSSLIIPFIFVCAIFGVRKILVIKWLGHKRWLLFILIVSSTYAAICLGPLPMMARSMPALFRLKDSPDTQVKNFFIREIPSFAAVISTFKFSSHLVNRKCLAYFYVFTSREHEKFIPEIKEHYDYALIDFDDPMTFYTIFYNHPDNLKERCFVFGKDWGLSETVDSIALFKKGYKSDFKIIESAGFLTPQDKEKIKEASDIWVFTAGCKEAKIDNFSVFEVECRLAKLRENSRNYLPIIRITDSRGAYFDRPLIASFRIFPYKEWRENEIVKIREK